MGENGLAPSVLGEFLCKITNRLTRVVKAGDCVITLSKSTFDLHFFLLKLNKFPDYLRNLKTIVYLNIYL